MTSKTMPSIQLSVTPSAQFWADIITTIVESGCLRYWGYCSDYSFAPAASARVLVRADDPWKDVEVTATVAYEWEPPLEVGPYSGGARRVLDAVSLAAGGQAILHPAFQINSNLRGTIIAAVLADDGSDIDDVTGDALAQAALLGEIVYG